MKSTKKIHSVTVKRMIDTDPDTSWWGEYSNKAESDYAIDRAHSEDCQAVEANHRQAVDTLENAIDHVMHSDAESDFYDDAAVDLLREKQEECQECDCPQGGSWSNREYRYFNPNHKNYKGDTEENIRKYCRQDYERMEALNNQQWGFIGIRAEAEFSIGNEVRGGHCLMQELSSGGLWGIESDSDAGYFESIEAEELENLKTQLEGIGFSKRAIATAFKNVEHKDE